MPTLERQLTIPKSHMYIYTTIPIPGDSKPENPEKALN